jgi:anaerobic magnesium-protoporphyrin IX monomethyl ester cyclase
MMNKVLIVYPNLPLMMAPAISVGIFTAICKKNNVEIKVFETTQYSDQYSNRHIRMTEIGANRPNKDEEVKDMFYIKPSDRIKPDLIKCLEDYKPDLILMSIQEDTWYQSLMLLEIIEPYNIPHLIGGVFPSMVPDLVISHPLVKNIVKGEGEIIVEKAVQGVPLSQIDGVWWKDESGNIKRNKPQVLCDITKITPDFSEFSNIRWQRPMGGRVFERALSIETYRGCPYNCTYCNSPYTRIIHKDMGMGNFMRRKSADIVERDLIYYKEHINPDLIMFMDDSFLARPKKEIFDLCKILSKHNIPFWFNSRIENCTPEILSALKDAGAYRMTFGIESGNEEYRAKFLKRNVSNTTYLKHLEYINESNIPYSLNVIIGMPFETRDMVLETAKMVRSAKGYDGLTISMFQPYHGTDLRKIAVDNGFLDPNHINGTGATGQKGGYLDNWALSMPEPYLQNEDVQNLIKAFSLYAYFPDSRWGEVNKAESDDNLYKTLFNEYQKNFFGDIQKGGKDRINQKYCMKHDQTATYEFTEVL